MLQSPTVEDTLHTSEAKAQLNPVHEVQQVLINPYARDAFHSGRKRNL